MPPAPILKALWKAAAQCDTTGYTACLRMHGIINSTQFAGYFAKDET